MFIRCEESDQPGIIVGEGETFTLTAQHSQEYPGLIARLRPRTTAALLVAAGRPPAKPLRLSDGHAFEQVQNVEGLVNLHDRDDDGRVAGYSVAFLSRIFDALDPDSRTPPSTVQWRARARPDSTHGCGCKGASAHATTAAMTQVNQSVLASDIYARIDAPVPKFISEINVHIAVPYISDIIVNENATLVLDDSVGHLIARNVFCYNGSRIVQKSQRINVDITGVLRGGIPNYVKFFTGVDILKIKLSVLEAIAADKP